MRDPVMCADGHSYERTAIATWLQGYATSPCTNLRLRHIDLVPNIALLNSIEEWGQKTLTLGACPASREVSQCRITLIGGVSARCDGLSQEYFLREKAIA